MGRSIFAPLTTLRSGVFVKTLRGTSFGVDLGSDYSDMPNEGWYYGLSVFRFRYSLASITIEDILIYALVNVLNISVIFLLNLI